MTAGAQHLCPACRRRFDEAGFCPFDGTPLAAAPAEASETRVSAGSPAAVGPTVVSAVVPAVAPDVVTAHELLPLRPPAPPAGAPDTETRTQTQTQIESHHRTFPLTPSPPVGTGEITAARTRPGPGPGQARPHTPSEPVPMRVLSASENPAEALELVRQRGNDYDKLLGQTLDGRYLVEAKIGEGGMGVVFRARHAVIERPLAIKVLKREAMRDTATIRRFVQEAKAASRIGHPNIVDVTDFGTTPDGMTYSVMEFVPGVTLGAAIRQGAPFAAPRAIRITAQIARALAAAHDKGIVHRDLKPENVFLLDRDGRPDFVKIVDFGIAKVTPPPGRSAEPRLTRAGSVFGTPEYMAPEQAAGRSDTDGRVDVYALGVILYEMLCARVPHRGDSMVRTLAMQMLDPIEPPSKVRPDLAIAPELEAIVMRALVKKREQRYQTMGELLDALEAILPPPVGQSVTGSPVYTLAALPPGADPHVVASLPAMPLQSSDAAPRPPGAGGSGVPAAARARSASSDGTPAHAVARPAVDPAAAAPLGRRVKDEPVFTGEDRPVSFEHVFTEEHVQPGARRWPVLLLLSLIAGGAVGAVALVIKSRGAAGPDRREDPRDPVVVLPADAGVAPDAALTDPPADAPDLIVVPVPSTDAGVRLRPGRGDAGVPAVTVPETPNRRGTILVQVLTKPEGALLYEGTTYRGPGGAQLEEAFGSRRVITCKQTGYKPGTVEVVFDGSTEAVLCVLQRIRVCINGIKNPFDDCEEAPPR